MKHLKNLIKGTIADSKAPWAISEDMSDMYKQDAKDFKDILKMIKDKNFSGAKKLIQFMDTLPREGVLVAIARDLGNDWVEENLEYEVRI
jgi:hypothetical protein|tara:strand:+ start:368 stop:637 length:270 start_codon:yes stop_codon:yes gene_type:complete